MIFLCRNWGQQTVTYWQPPDDRHGGGHRDIGKHVAASGNLHVAHGTCPVARGTLHNAHGTWQPPDDRHGGGHQDIGKHVAASGSL